MRISEAAVDMQRVLIEVFAISEENARLSAVNKNIKSTIALCQLQTTRVFPEVTA